MLTAIQRHALRRFAESVYRDRGLTPSEKAALLALQTEGACDPQVYASLQRKLGGRPATPARRFAEPARGGAAPSRERLDYLLSLTPRGQALLASNASAKQNARFFAEALESVLQRNGVRL